MADAGCVCIYDTPCVFLPGTVAETFLTEERQRASVLGADDHFADIVSLGDLDADGQTDDWVIGASSSTMVKDGFTGAVYVFSEPLAGDYADADAVFCEDDEDWGYGCPGGFVTGVGDTDGDGYDDLLMGTWGTSPAWLFRGGPR